MDEAKKVPMCLDYGLLLRLLNILIADLRTDDRLFDIRQYWVSQRWDTIRRKKLWQLKRVHNLVT